MVSVIVPAYRAPTLPACVERILSQQLDEPFEVLVCASADTVSELPSLACDPRLRMFTHVPRLAAAPARNRCAQMARGRLLAFTDADAFPEPGWLAALVGASQGRFCVAGSVANGTPASVAGTAEYLVEFLDLNPARPPATLWHGATCNLLVPKALWERLGPFCEDLGGGEDTVLTAAAGRAGLLRFAPAAVVTHQNRTRWSRVIGHQLELGRFTARVARRSPHRRRALVRYPPLAPLALAGRLVSLYIRAAQSGPPLLLRALRLLPATALLLGAWAWGLTSEGVRLDWRAWRSRASSSARGGLQRSRRPSK